MNRKSTWAFQQAVDGVHQRVAQKAIILVLKNIIQFHSNKFCYKVPLCENFWLQSCSIIYLKVHRYWHEMSLQPKI